MWQLGARPPTTAVPAKGLVPRAHDRLESLDAMRGLTVAGMILVNNPGE